MTTTPDSVDHYLAGLPEDVRARVQLVRDLVHEMAPSATETISYKIPTFKIGKHSLIHVAAWKRHIALYPATSDMEREIPGVAERSSGKGTCQFPHAEPLPLDIIRTMLEYRLRDVGAEPQSAN
jgi:uncharacterized protein YdhG (YjbR/CyaY superfamily)